MYARIEDVSSKSWFCFLGNHFVCLPILQTTVSGTAVYCVKVKVLDHGLILCYSYIIYMLSMLEGLSWNIVLINCVL